MDIIERTLLWSAVESCPGLWEAAWEINSLRPETGGERGNQALAARVMRSLLERGLIQLFRADDLADELRPLITEEGVALLTEAAAWEPPDSYAEVLRYGATAAGERYYFARQSR